MLRIIILSLLIANLTACFIAPGMRMPSPPETKASYQARHEIKLDFIPVTVDLVDSMKHYDRITHRHNKRDYHYLIGEHDILNIYVWSHPEFDVPIGAAATESGMNTGLNPSISPAGYLVSADGDIHFPLVGTVHVGNLTTDDVRVRLTYSLRRYIVNPQVDVRVTSFRSRKIYIMGEVAHPGLQPLTDAPMSITDAINLAGGLVNDSADPKYIFVIRGDFARPRVYWLNARSPAALLMGEHFNLLPHDVLFISTAQVSLWNRAISQILPTIQAFWFTRSIVQQW